MCDLCSDDQAVRQKERARLREEAERLDKLAGYYRALSSGVWQPHDQRSKDMASTVRGIVRELVMGWV